MSFDSFSFDQRIRAGIIAAGYTTPTPIQTRAIPAVLAGKDVMGLAQTGTGKTAAFVLPLLQRLLDAKAGTRGPIRVLVLAPTRELAVQIHETFIDLGKQTGFRSTVVIGGVGQNPQVKSARQATMLVACPGRLLDLLNQRLVDLAAVSALILDEADRMFDMGFLPDVKKIMAQLPRQRQTLLFSATMPAEVRALAESVLRDPVVVQVSNTAPAATISHAIYPVAASRKQDLLERLLTENGQGSALVFTRTKHRAKGLAKKLAGNGFAATALQGNLSQNRRQEAMDGFRNGTYRVMVATDIAARGIDCERVSLVVNFDMPDTAEAYTHRIGRTGRAERSGQAVSLVAPEDEGQARFIERALNMRIERKRMDGFADAKAGAPQVAAQPRASQGRSNQNRSGQNHPQNRPGQERIEQSLTGQPDSLQGRPRKESSGRGRSSQDRPALERSAQERPGPVRSTVSPGDLQAAATKGLLPNRAGARVQEQSQVKPSGKGKPTPGAKAGEARPRAAGSAGKPGHGFERDGQTRGDNGNRTRHSDSGEDRWSKVWSKVLLSPAGDGSANRRARDTRQTVKPGRSSRRSARPGE